MRMLRIQTPDNNMKTLLVKENKVVYDLMDDICKRIGIPNNHEYSLASTKEAVKTTLEMRNKEKMEAIKSQLYTEDEGLFLEKFFPTRVFSELVGCSEDLERAGHTGVGDIDDEKKIFLQCC